MAFPGTSPRILLCIALSLGLLALLIPAPGAAQPAHHKGKGTTAAGRKPTKAQMRHTSAPSLLAHSKASVPSVDAGASVTGAVTSLAEVSAEPTAASAQAEATPASVGESLAAEATGPSSGGGAGVSVDGGDTRGDASLPPAEASTNPA